LIGNRQFLVARITRLEGAKTRLQRCFTRLVVIIRVLIAMTRRDSFSERSISHSKIVY